MPQPPLSQSSADEHGALRAAEAWANAVEALAEAERQKRDVALEKEAMRIASIALYDAVLALRATQRTPDFTGVRGSTTRSRYRIVDLLERL
jgi:regulator of protease activity HflC (stomatin/prohibitin superfamily)